MATFSVTDRGSFRRCRRMWDWSSNARQNLTGLGSGPEPLELGGLIHRALADWIAMWRDNPSDATKDGRLKYLFVVHASQRQQEIIDAYCERIGTTEMPKVHLESLHNVVNLGMSMMENYQTYHKTPLPEHMSFASAEQEVLIPVPGTEHQCKCYEQSDNYAIQIGLVRPPNARHYSFGDFYGRPDCVKCVGKGFVSHYLSATLDGLLQDNRDRFLVLEHKTYDNRPKLMDLFMNDQFTGYAWVVRELKIGTVAGIAYDGMWKRAKFGMYLQKEKRKSTLEDLFIRKVIAKGEGELDQWGDNLALEINEMANDPEIYPNVPWMGCSDCRFQEPCRMVMLGEDPSRLIRLQYTQREVIRGGQSKDETNV